MTTRSALEATTRIHAELAAAGLPRNSTYTGGEIVGWTEAFGSTGFSIRPCDDGTLQWHVVVSGEPHLTYDRYEEEDESLHDPIDPEGLCPRIRAVFEAQGLEILSIRYAGHQRMWDDDVQYVVTTTHPAWLEPRPAKRQHGRFR